MRIKAPTVLALLAFLFLLASLYFASGVVMSGSFLSSNPEQSDEHRYFIEFFSWLTAGSFIASIALGAAAWATKRREMRH